MPFTDTDITSLTSKLVELDLTDPEREALQTIVALGVAATDDEVVGFDYEAITVERGVVDFGPLLRGIGQPAVWKAPAGRSDGFIPTGETVL